MLPDSLQIPTTHAQPSADPSVSRLVCFQFGQPKPLIALGLTTTPFTTAPEPAIHEHGELLFLDRKVRTTGVGMVLVPTCDAIGSQKSAKTISRLCCPRRECGTSSRNVGLS